MSQLEKIKKFSPFEKMDNARLEKIIKLIQNRKFNEDEIIFNSGDAGENLYFIEQGQVEISVPVINQKNCTVAEFSAGEFFGELSFLKGDTHSAKAMAKQETNLLVLNSRDYETILKDYKKEGIEIQQQILLKIISRLRNINQKY